MVMNPISVDPTAPPPPPPPQPPRSSFSCDRHPTEQFNGFCPSCLCERLTTLDDNSSSNTPSTSRRPSSVSAAIKSLFSYSKGTDLPPPPLQPPKPSKPTSFFPELRRTKSFSASKNEALSLVFEPQRKSCDVRNTLWSLFTIENKTVGVANNNKPSSSSSSSSHQNPQINKLTESFVGNKSVSEETENEEDYRDPEYVEEDIVDFVDDDDSDGDEIRVVQDSQLDNLVKVEVKSGEIVKEALDVSNNTFKPMKDHIDRDTQNGKKISGGGFWAATSVLSKKWQNWRRKQKVKKQNNGENIATLPVEKPISRQFRETQSEIADYGFGRRSCDTDPRFSLDAGRISFDDPRYSFDEPRASWDGYMIGRRSFSRMAPPMVSVMEDVPVHVPRTDMQIPVEEPSMNGDDGLPGGLVQTKVYYLDSSSKRRKSVDMKSVDRKSFDRSSSIKKTAASVVAEIDELKMVSNAKVSPTTAEYFHGAKVLDLRDSNSNSLRGDGSESFEYGRNSVIRNGDRNESKKSKRWSWKIWGFKNRRNGKDGDDDEKYSRVNGVGRSFSESWQDSRIESNRDLRNGVDRNVFRSNSSVSWRNADHIGGSFGSLRQSGFEMNGHGKKIVLEKNRSARYSPNHIDNNGLLRFYLPPMGASQRGGMDKIKQNNTHSIARSVLRIY